MADVPDKGESKQGWSFCASVLSGRTLQSFILKFGMLSKSVFNSFYLRGVTHRVLVFSLYIYMPCGDSSKIM